MKTNYLLEKYKLGHNPTYNLPTMDRVYFITFSTKAKVVDEITSDMKFGNQFYYRVIELVENES